MIESYSDLVNELGKLNSGFNSYYIKILNKIKEHVSSIKNDANKFNDIIQNYLKISKKYELEKDIDLYIKKINIEETKKENMFSKLKMKLKDFNEMTANVYVNNFIKNIKELNENLNNLLNQLADKTFLPPITNNFTDSSVDLLINSSKFYDEEILNNKSEKKEKSEIIKCTVCNNNEYCCYCEKCNNLFCSECLEKAKIAEEKEKKNHKHKYRYVDDLKNHKTLFLKSVNALIENILINSNYILNIEKIKVKNMNSNNSNLKIDYIRRNLDFPYFTNYYDFNSQIEFLKEINSITKNELNVNYMSNNSFHISEMNKDLIFSIKRIFNDEKVSFYKLILSNIDSAFYSGDDFSDEKYLVNCQNEYEEIKNNFSYTINLNPFKRNLVFEPIKIGEILTDQINSKLYIDKENIFITFNNICNFIDSFIRTKTFFELPPQKLKTQFPNLNLLNEFKIIVDDLFSNKFDIRNDLDYRGNFIFPNKSLNLYRGTEKYDPPYGWIGIGLNVSKKYEDDNWLKIKDKSSTWAIAYHGVGRISTFDEIINMVKNIINEGLKPGPSQIKCHSNDIRHTGKKIGTGVYLTPSINLAEEYSGIISYNNKKYNIVLMTKVLIDKIKEPEDFNYWILNKDYIRVYRILLKEKT